MIATMRSPEKETELNKLENVQLEKLDVLDLNSINLAIQNGVQKFWGKHNHFLPLTSDGLTSHSRLNALEKVARSK